MTLTAHIKGLFGEGIIIFSCWLFLKKTTYRRLHNITLPLADGGSTQIDHIIVSRYGIFVIETKNYKGWIFGNEQQAQWTQTFRGGKKFHFQNPLRQNYLHLKTLARLLGLMDTKFHSMVIFVGKGQLKNQHQLPDNVMCKGWIGYIKAKKQIIFTDDQVRAITSNINTAKLKKSAKTNAEHKHYVQNKIETKATQAQKVAMLTSEIGHQDVPVCPTCDSTMIKRTATKGKNTGNEFWGCSTYPQCKGTRSLS